MASALHYVHFESLQSSPLSIAARLRVPETGGAPCPAVLLLHGSAGPSGREAAYADALLERGIATLEPDQWFPRGLKGGARGRPATVAETLPDVFGAKRFLESHASIDPARIAVIGFSFGGVAALLAATRDCCASFAIAPFAAYAALYPVCWLYNRVPGFELRDLVRAPLLIITGEADQYDDDPRAAENLIATLDPRDRLTVRTCVIEGAPHGFDMPDVDMVAEDPAAHRGAGGQVVVRYEAEGAAKARTLVVEHFASALIPSAHAHTTKR
jgi:dienelactone hydrolase